MQVKLTPQELDKFEKFAKGYNAGFLLEYLDKLKAIMFDPASLSADNLESRRQAQLLLESELINPIKRLRNELPITQGGGDYE